MKKRYSNNAGAQQKQEGVFNSEIFDISVGSLNNKNVIWIRFDYDPKLVKFVKENASAKYYKANKTWYLYDNKFNRKLCGLSLKIVGKKVLSKISAVNLPELKRLQNKIKLMRYSPNTLRTYSLEFAQLLYVLKEFPVQKMTPKRLQSYFLYCSTELGLSENQIHSRINAVKFYFEKILHQPRMFFDIPRPKKPKSLPKTLNRKEINNLFLVTDNLKHRLILKLCYGMGLRVSEIVNLKISDIDSERMLVHIERAKGKKDRYVPLPKTALNELRQYYKEHRPKNYLFEGQRGGAYSKRSAQMVFKNAMQKAGIQKRIGIHGLRHSYATHLLEMGTDISFIQQLLGHNDIKTTLLYAEVSNRQLNRIKSPLDSL